MSEELLRPAEVCKRLGMPPSTLRIYSTKFAEVLSDSAARPPVTRDGKVGHRVYTGRDLVVLKKAKELLGQGLTYDQVLAELRLLVPGRARGRAAGVAAAEAVGGEVGGVVGGADMEKVLAVLARAVATAERSAETSHAVVGELRSELAELRARVERLERRIRGEEQEKKGGFWRRLTGG